MTIKTFFHETWQSVSGCMELIVRSVAKESAQDKLFKCDISLSNMSEKPLYSYLARKKQVNNVWVILLGVLFNARHPSGGIFCCTFATRSFVISVGML